MRPSWDIGEFVLPTEETKVGAGDRTYHTGRYLGETAYFVEFNLDTSSPEPLDVQAERIVDLPGCFAIVISKQWRKALGATKIEPL